MLQVQAAMSSTMAAGAETETETDRWGRRCCWSEADCSSLSSPFTKGFHGSTTVGCEIVLADEQSNDDNVTACGHLLSTRGKRIFPQKEEADLWMDI
jgi:hypothetical protein